jgi:hypothetical protein
MSARARRPTDEIATEIYDPVHPRVLLQKPAPAAPLTPLLPSLEHDLEQETTEVTPIPTRGPIDLATPTHIDPTPGDAASHDESSPPAEPAAPAQGRRFERSEPIRVFSMKHHTDPQKPRADDPRVQLQVQLRSLAEVAGRSHTPGELGRLAPPRDPRQARARHVRANVTWACIAIALACAISLSIWLIAGR